MATVRQYFETDFPQVAKLCCRLPFEELHIETKLLCDFSGFMNFVSLYIPDENRQLPFFIKLIKQLQYEKTQLTFDGNIQLPSSWDFPAELQIGTKEELTVHCRFHGSPRWISWNEMPMSKRVFIYSESDLSEEEILRLQAEGLTLGHDVEFRSHRHVMERSRSERPVAFISHDSRDGDIARRIAIGLQKMRCSVWYDE